jgi:hypothetical protein
MYLHISPMYAHSGEAVRDRGGTLSFSLPRRFWSDADPSDIGRAFH